MMRFSDAFVKCFVVKFYIPLHNFCGLQCLQLIQHFNFNLQLTVFLSRAMALLQ